MFDKEKVLQLRDLTGFGLKMAREVLEDGTLTVYVHPSYEGQAWATLGEAMQSVRLHEQREVKAYTLKLKGGQNA